MCQAQICRPDQSVADPSSFQFALWPVAVANLTVQVGLQHAQQPEQVTQSGDTRRTAPHSTAACLAAQLPGPPLACNAHRLSSGTFCTASSKALTVEEEAPAGRVRLQTAPVRQQDGLRALSWCSTFGVEESQRSAASQALSAAACEV